MKKIERSYLITHYSTIKGLPDVRYVKVKESDLDELEQQRDEAVEMLIKWHSIVFDKPFNANEIMECDHLQLVEKLTGQTWEQIKAGKR